MKCKNCGQELKEKDKKCSSCGMSVEDAKKIKITYADEETEFVDPPVITEAHTFIDEESFAKKINKENQTKSIEEDMWDDSDSKGPIIGIFIVIVLIALGFVGYFVVYPNIKTNKEKEIISHDFTTENWTSGEFKIQDSFYQVNQTYSKYYLEEWNFIDEDTLYLNLEPKEETEEYKITNKKNQIKMYIQLRNNKKTSQLMKESIVWSVKLDTTEEDNEVDFVLPGQIKNGSTEEDIQAKYGMLTEDNVIRDDETKSTTYHYSSKNKKNLDLVVYDDKGLKAFQYYFS